MAMFKKEYKFLKIDMSMDASSRDINTAFDKVNMESFFTRKGYAIIRSVGPEMVDESEGSYVIGSTSLEDVLYIFVTQSVAYAGLSNSIYKCTLVDGVYTATFIKGSNDWGFSTDYPIQAVSNVNNGRIKLYWVDGLNQFSSTFVDDTDTDVAVVSPHTSPTVLTNPEEANTIGNYTVRYAASAHELGGMSTKLGFLSNPEAIVTTDEIRSGVRVTVSGIDPLFNLVRLYRFKWSSYYGAPAIDLIHEFSTGSDTVSFLDNGESSISTISISEVFDLGSTYLKPDAIVSKKGNLILGNLESSEFNLSDEIIGDLRMFQYSKVTIAEAPHVITESVQGTATVDNIVTLSDDRYLFSENGPDNPVRKDGLHYVETYEYTDWVDYGACDSPDPEETDTQCDGFQGQTMDSVLGMLLVKIPTHESYATKLKFKYNPKLVFLENGSAKVRCLIIKSRPFGSSVDLATKTFAELNQWLDANVDEVKVCDDYNFENSHDCSNQDVGYDYDFPFTNHTTHNGFDVATSWMLLVLDEFEFPVYGAQCWENPPWSMLNNLVSARFDGPNHYITVNDTNYVDTHYSTAKYPEFWTTPSNQNVVINKMTLAGIDLNLTEVDVEIIATSSWNDVPSFKIKRAVSDLWQDNSYQGEVYIEYTFSFKTTAEVIGRDVASIPLNSSTGVLIGEYNSPSDVPKNIDAVNPDRQFIKYSSPINQNEGAIGVYLKLDFNLVSTNTKAELDFKSGETYRLGVVCINEFGLESPAYWLMDLYIPRVNITGERQIYRPEITVIKTIPGVVKMKIVKVLRTNADLTVGLQGIPQPIFSWGDIINGSAKTYTQHFPAPAWRWVGGLKFASAGDIFNYDESTKNDFGGVTIENDTVTLLDFKKKNLVALFSPDLYLNTSYTGATHIEHIGAFTYKALGTYLTRRTVKGDGTVGEGKYYDSVGPVYQTHSDTGNIVTYSLFTKTEGFTSVSPDNPIKYAIKSSEVSANKNSIVLGSTFIQGKVNIDKFAMTTATDADKEVAIEKSYLPYLAIESDIDALFGTLAGIPLAETIYENVNQYGGSNINVKQSNTYIDASSSLFNAPGESVILFGDIHFVSIVMLKAAENEGATRERVSNLTSYVNIRIETRVNPDGIKRYPYYRSENASEENDEIVPLLSYAQLVEYNSALSVVPSLDLSLGIGFLAIKEVPMVTRLIASNSKFEGELWDSWAVFGSSNILDLEGEFGELVRLVRVKDQVIAFQKTGIATISVYPERQATDGSGMILAKGRVLDNYKYVYTKLGISTIFSLTVTSSNVFFIDHITKTINAFDKGDIGQAAGLHLHVQETLKLTTSSEDVKDTKKSFVFSNESKGEIYFYLGDNEPALVFNFLLNTFTHRRTYDMNYALEFKNSFLMHNDGAMYVPDTGVIGNYFYDKFMHRPSYRSSTLILLADPMTGTDKVFDSISLEKTGEANFSSIKCELPSEDEALNSSVVWKGKYGSFSTHLPRVSGTRSRLRGHNIKLTLSVSGSVSTELDIHKFHLNFTIKK